MKKEKEQLKIVQVIPKRFERMSWLNHLKKTNLKGIFNVLQQRRDENQLTESPDIQILRLLPPFLRLPVAVSHRAVREILSDSERSMGLLPKIIEKVLGGEGTLTVNRKTGAAQAVLEHFGKKVMNSQEFADDLRERTEDLFERIAADPETPPEKIILDSRLQLLSHVFMSDELTNEEMRSAFDFTNDVFSDLQSYIFPFLQSFFSRSSIDRFLKKKNKVQSIQITQAIERIIHDRNMFSNDRVRRNDFFDLMIDKMVEQNEIDGSHLDIESLLKIRSNFLQVLFAATETTSSAQRSLWYMLATDKEEQQRLRQHAFAFLKTKGNTGLRYEDLTSEDPHLGEIMKFVGKGLHLYAPTFAAARGGKPEDVLPSNPIGVLTDLSAAAHENVGKFMQISRPKINDIMIGGEFGAGGKVCKGGPFAIYELVQTVITFLTKSQDISVIDEGVEQYTTTYQRVGMKLKITSVNN